MLTAWLEGCGFEPCKAAVFHLSSKVLYDSQLFDSMGSCIGHQSVKLIGCAFQHLYFDDDCDPVSTIACQLKLMTDVKVHIPIVTIYAVIMFKGHVSSNSEWT